MTIWLESFISQNIRKTFFEKYKKFFQGGLLFFSFFELGLESGSGSP